MRKKPTPLFARASSVAIANANSTCSGTAIGDHPDQRVLDGDPGLRIDVQQVVVVRPADPARRREQVVVVEREVRAHHERVAEEDREPDDPRAHQEQDEAAAPPVGPPPRPRAQCRTARGVPAPRRVDALAHGTPPPPLACATWASSCLASFFETEPSRSLHVAGLPLLEEVLDGVRVRLPRREDRRGVRTSGCAKIFRNVEKCASGMISFECSDARRRRHVAQPVREHRQRVVGRRQVLDERPRLVLVLARRAGCR